MPGKVILLNKSLTDLAVAYQKICEFNLDLEHEWIPGFHRSFERRQAAYLKAVDRYEQRSKVTRLIFKAPKQPGRPSPSLQDEVTEHLWQDWTASLNHSIEVDDATENPETSHLVEALSQRMDDQFFALTELQTNYEQYPVTVVVGPSGGMIVRTKKKNKTQMIFEPLPQTDTEGLDKDPLDQLVVFLIIDDLLSYHQKIHVGKTISALREAEHLMDREKDNLLKLAATL